MIWEYKTLKVSELTPATYNPREISKDEFEGLKNSLKTFGFADPAVVNSNNNVIVGGHQRIKAWEALGNKDVPCMLAPLTEEQEKKLNVLLNSQAISGKYDDLMLSELLEGMKLDDDYEALRLEQLEPLDLSDTEVVEDEAPEVSQEPPKSELGKVYQLGRHRVMCADSTVKENVEKLMDGVKPDGVHTDPPYGLGKKMSGGTWATKASHYSDMHEWDKVAEQSFFDTAISQGCDAIVWGGNYFTTPPSRGWLIWKKPNFPTMADCEIAFTTKDMNARVLESNRSDPNKLHPTQKPMEVTNWSLSFLDGKNILDLFLGSGSTLIACEQTDRTCYGMELDPKYTDVIRKRWVKFVHGEEALQDDKWIELTPSVE